MFITCPHRTDVIAAQNRFFVSTAACLTVLITLHWLPKHVPAPVRLAYTIAYFAALLLLLYQFIAPLRHYLKLLFGWRFAGAPDPIQRACQSFLFSVNQVIAVPVYILMSFFGSLALISRDIRHGIDVL